MSIAPFGASIDAVSFQRSNAIAPRPLPPTIATGYGVPLAAT